MEIVKKLTREQAIEIMKERGYGLVSESGNGETVNFAKTIDLGVCLHASVNIPRMDISLDMVELKFMCTLNIVRFDFFHKQFDKYEKILYLYTKACLEVNDIFTLSENITVGNKLPGENSEKIFVIKSEKIKKTIKERKIEFWTEVAPIAKQKGLTKEFTMEFYSYWTEHGPNDKKFRRETEQKFDISRRLDTFVRNEKKWNKTFVDKKVEKQDQELKERKTIVKHEDLF